MIYRITFGFSGEGKGWTETHAMLNASDNPRDLVPTLQDIAQKRAQMLGREFAIVGIRISRYANDAGVRQRGVILIKQTFKNSVTTQAASSEPAVVALQVRGYAEPSLVNPEFNANTKQIFLGAPLDDCVDNGGHVDQGKGGLGAAFAAWRSAMLGTTMGWLANRTDINAEISSIEQDPTGTVLFEMEPDDISSMVENQFYTARVRRVNQGRSPLNGALLVKRVSPSTLETQAIIGIPTPQTGGSIRIYKKVQPFVDYGDLILSDTTVKHQRGLPFGFSRGRAPKRIRG